MNIITCKFCATIPAIQTVVHRCRYKYSFVRHYFHRGLKWSSFRRQMKYVCAINQTIFEHSFILQEFSKYPRFSFTSKRMEVQ